MAADNVFNPADSLLSFMNSATNNIHEAMNNAKTKRKVNIRRFISKNVNKPARKRLQVTNRPKTVAQTKPLSAAPNPQSDECHFRPEQTTNPLYCNDRCHVIESHPDAEITQILYELTVPENYIARITPEEQVNFAQLPYSPYSDCSEEWLDIPYSSPSCCSNAYLPAPHPTTDLYELMAQGSPTYSACNPALDQGLPVTPTIHEVLDPFFGW